MLDGTEESCTPARAGSGCVCWRRRLRKACFAWPFDASISARFEHLSVKDVDEMVLYDPS
jgi:hypothetical protein